MDLIKVNLYTDLIMLNLQLVFNFMFMLQGISVSIYYLKTAYKMFDQIQVSGTNSTNLSVISGNGVNISISAGEIAKKTEIFAEIDADGSEAATDGPTVAADGPALEAFTNGENKNS